MVTIEEGQAWEASLRRGVGPARSLDALVARVGDPSVIPTDILADHRAGHVRRARTRLLAHVRRETDPARASIQRAALRDLHLWVTPADHPGVSSLSGLGTAFFGRYQEDRDGSWVATHWATVLHVPVWPLGAYLVSDGVDEPQVHGSVPLPPLARLWRYGVGAAAALGLSGWVAWRLNHAGVR